MSFKFLVFSLGLLLSFVQAFAAVGSWNGVAFTAWNGVAQTGWNGTSVSCAGGGGGPDLWYYPGSGLGDTSFAGGPVSSAYTPHLFAYGSSITVAQAGTCTKLAARVIGENPTTPTIRISLYNNSNALISSGTADEVLVSPTATAGWYEVTLATPVAVTATTYKVVLSSSVSTLNIYYSATGNGFGDDQTYATFPPATLVPVTETGTMFAVRMYVD